MGKHKDEQENLDNTVAGEEEKDGVPYEEKLKYVSIIAQPMASRKLAGRIYKLIKKGESAAAWLAV